MSEFRIRVLGKLPPADPAAVLRATPAGSAPVLLDDSAQGGGLLAWHPDRRVEWTLPRLAAQDHGGPAARWPIAAEDPLLAWQREAEQEAWSCELSLPWFGGWLGFLGFEAGHAYLPFPWTRPEPSGLPHASFARYPRSLWFSPEATYVLGTEDEAAAWLAEARGVVAAAQQLPAPRLPELNFERSVSAEAFQQGVAHLRDQIGAGELFQANLSHRLSAPHRGDPRASYAALRPAQPTRMSAYWEDEQGRALLSWSPERFLSWHGERLQTRPIKGTAPRAMDRQEDARLAAALEASEKERAELTMIVDMARNDLGQVAQPGSVQVLSPGEVEPYPTLFHRTATVEARLRDGAGLAEILRASFPPASVTGAPKVRALQAIAELEQEQRGAYCGALGIWVPGQRRADFSVLIRTASCAAGSLHLRVGAGIVWDSDPRREWEETLVKARYLESLHEPASLRVR